MRLGHNQGFAGTRARRLSALLAAVAVCAIAPAAHAEGIRLYGFAQLDYTQDFNRVDPDWEDSLRPSKIPTEDGVFGDDGNAVLSIRQSRLGAEYTTQAGEHELTARLEFDFYGVGGNAGEVAPRMRHAYGQWGPFLIGQTHSVFMDIDIFPNTVEYWGPPGMVFVRKPQIRWTFVDDARQRGAIALEDPGSDIDAGDIRELDPALGASIVPKERFPDLTAHYRFMGNWGHVQLAGIVRSIGYETLGTPGNEPSDDLFGWGLNLTGTFKTGERNKFLIGATYGEGIASYMNDGGVDIAPEGEPGDLDGEAVPLWGFSIYYDHYWNDQYSSSIGYSRTQVDNRSFQSPDAFEFGEYASVNLLYTPAENLLFGIEALYGGRADSDTASGEDYRVQFTAKYSFSGEF